MKPRISMFRNPNQNLWYQKE